MTTTSTLPPPLSAPPTLATLQGLLDGLQQPMHRGVPSPPTPDGVSVEATERPASSPAPSGPTPSAPSGPATSAEPALTWSAGRGHHHRRAAVAAVVIVAAAAGTVAALVAAGELGLP